MIWYLCVTARVHLYPHIKVELELYNEFSWAESWAELSCAMKSNDGAGERERARTRTHTVAIGRGLDGLGRQMWSKYLHFSMTIHQEHSDNNMTIFFTPIWIGQHTEWSFVTFETYYRSTDGFYLRLNLHRFACVVRVCVDCVDVPGRGSTFCSWKQSASQSVGWLNTHTHTPSPIAKLISIYS